MILLQPLTPLGVAPSLTTPKPDKSLCHLRKGYFDHPPALEHLEPGRPLRWRLTGGDPHPSAGPPVAGDLQRPAQLLAKPAGQPAIGRVGPEQAHLRERLVQAGQHPLGGGPVMQVGWEDLGLEQQALRVDHQMALATVDLLAAVVAARPAHLGGLDRLAVDDRGGGPGGAPHHLACTLAQRGVDRLPQAAQAPLPKVVEHRLPRRKVSRQHPPGHAATQDVEDGIEDLVQNNGASTPSALRLRKQRLEDRILFVGQITVVVFVTHPLHICRVHSQTSSYTNPLKF